MEAKYKKLFKTLEGALVPCFRAWVIPLSGRLRFPRERNIRKAGMAAHDADCYQ